MDLKTEEIKDAGQRRPPKTGGERPHKTDSKFDHRSLAEDEIRNGCPSHELRKTVRKEILRFGLGTWVESPSQFLRLAQPIETKRAWDLVFGVGSLVAALMQGLILGGLMQGVTVQNRHFAGSVLDIFRPLPIISGTTLLFGYAVVGGGWLKLKSNISLQHFVSRCLRVAAPAFAVFFGIACICAVRIQPGIRAQWASHGIALACLVGLFAIAAGTITALPGTRRPAVPFLLGLLLFVVGITGIALIIFPEIVPFSVSLWDAASSPTSQRLVMIGAACVTPVVLAYSAFAYWIFRGKTPEDGWEA